MAKKLSMAMREEFAELEEEMDDWMMHTEMVKDEVSGGAARASMSKAWDNMDNAYEAFKGKAKLFIRAQQKFNESAGPRDGSFKAFFEAKKTKIVTTKDKDHWHEGSIDDEGDGQTTKTLPKGHADHSHKIVGAEVQATKGKDGHSHLLKD